MIELGWNKADAKWGGVDHSKVIWTHPGYTVDGGKLYGPGNNGVPINDCVNKPKYSDDVEFIQ